MNMNMTSPNGILSVPSEHLPGLIALLLLPFATWLATCALRRSVHRGSASAAAIERRLRSLSIVGKMALFGVAVGAVVHAVLVSTHWSDERTIAALFVADALGFIVAGIWMLAGWQFWRPATVLMLAGTAAVYAVYILRGWESPDPVGIATTTLELTGALVLLVPARLVVRPRGQRWAIALSMPVAVVVLVCATALADSTASATVLATPTSGSGASITAMSMGGGAAADLSLATSSTAGPIIWPDPMTTMMPGMEMVNANCTAQPTVTQQNAAVGLVNQTMATVAPYTSLTAARAAGYVPVTPTGKRVVYYINYSVARHAAPIDPDAVPVLVYVNTEHGAVLSAAMFLATGVHAEKPPQPGGCLTQWHIHSDLCFSAGSVVGNDARVRCISGSAKHTTMPTMHVWLAPVSGGPLASDPSVVSEVEAAALLRALPVPNGVA